MWVYLLFLVIGAPLTLVLHELSHLIVMVCGGLDIVAFRPWPHYNKYLGRWVLGSVSWRGLVNPELDALKAFAPLKKAIIASIIYLSAGSLYHPIWCLLFWELTDIGHWLYDYIRRKPKHDGGDYRILGEKTAG